MKMVLFLILIWAITAFVLFLDDSTTVKKTSDEKIDELINEIKGLRQDLGAKPPITPQRRLE